MMGQSWIPCKKHKTAKYIVVDLLTIPKFNILSET